MNNEDFVKDGSLEKNNYVETVEELVSRIKSIKEKIGNIYELKEPKHRQKMHFNHFKHMQKKCTHPEFYKITVENLFYYRKERERNKMISDYEWEIRKGGIVAYFAKQYLKDIPKNPYNTTKDIYVCSVCRHVCKDSKPYVKRLEDNNKDKPRYDFEKEYMNGTLSIVPVSDSAQKLYQELFEESKLFENELDNFISVKDEEIEKLKKEVEMLEKEAYKIAKILKEELDIKETEYVTQYRWPGYKYDD